MPLLLRFSTDQLRKVCEQRAVAERLLGVAAAQQLRVRLSDILAVSNLRDATLGSPASAPEGRIVFSLSPSHRLVVAPGVVPIPRLANKQVDWSKVDTVEVVEIK